MCYHGKQKNKKMEKMGVILNVNLKELFKVAIVYPKEFLEVILGEIGYKVDFKGQEGERACVEVIDTGGESMKFFGKTATEAYKNALKFIVRILSHCGIKRIILV